MPGRRTAAYDLNHGGRIEQQLVRVGGDDVA